MVIGLVAAALFIVALYLVLWYADFVLDVRDWNGGTCPWDGRPWERVPVAEAVKLGISPRGRTYRCSFNHFVRVEWKVENLPR